MPKCVPRCNQHWWGCLVTGVLILMLYKGKRCWDIAELADIYLACKRPWVQYRHCMNDWEQKELSVNIQIQKQNNKNKSEPLATYHYQSFLSGPQNEIITAQLKSIWLVFSDAIHIIMLFWMIDSYQISKWWTFHSLDNFRFQRRDSQILMHPFYSADSQ